MTTILGVYKPRGMTRYGRRKQDELRAWAGRSAYGSSAVGRRGVALGSRRLTLDLERRILIVEDERPLADAVARGLRHRAMAVDIAHEGDSALRKAQLVDYDVVVLDRDVPGIHGDDVCRALPMEEWGPAVLMLTAAGELDQIVEGLA